MGSVSVIGMGPSGGEYILPVGTAKIESADIIVGAERHVRAYTHSGKEIVPLQSNWKEAAAYIASASKENTIAVLVSGDPTLYSYAAALRRYLPGIEIDVIPGISSFQYLAAELGINWNGGAVVSVHGGPALSERKAHTGEILLRLCRAVQTVIVFTDGANNPGEVSRFLLKHFHETDEKTDWTVHIGCNLGGPDERIVSFPLAECAETWKDTEQLCVMILKKM